MIKFIFVTVAILFGSFALAQAATVLFVNGGGTGRATFTSSQLLYGNGTNALSSAATTSVTCSGGTTCSTFTALGAAPITISSVAPGSTIATTSSIAISELTYFTGVTPTVVGGTATTSATCSGSVSCSTFNVLGSSPITITGSGLSSYDAWTHPFVGGSATTSEMIFNGAASTTRLGAYTAFFGGTATSSFSSAGALTLITPLLVGSGGTGQNTFTSSQLLYGNGTNALTSVATTSLAVGIGLSTSGSAALVGSSQLTLSVASSSLFSGTTGQVAYFNGTNTIVGTSTLFITTGGIVGIGTTNPVAVNANAKLTVAGVSSQDIVASTTDNTTLSDAIFNAYAPGARIFMGAHGTNQVSTRYGLTLGGWGEISGFNSSSGTLSGVVLGTNTATPLVFGTNNLERIRIGSAGNVGIASSTPTNLLSLGTTGTTYGSIAVTENPLATSTSMTIDWTQGNQQLVRIGGSATTIGFSNASTTGQTLKLIVCNPGSTAGTITWNNAARLRWAGGTAPSQTTTANKCDVWSFLVTQATSTSAASPQTIFGAQTANF